MGKSSNVPGEVIVPVIIIIKILKSSIVFGRFSYLSVMDISNLIYMTQL